MQRGSTFKKFLHLNTVAFVKKGGQWAWKKTSKLFLIQFSTITISICSCFCCCCCCCCCCWRCFDFTRCWIKMSSTVKINSCQIYELCLCAKIYFPRHAWKIHPRKYISTNETSFTVVVITLRYVLLRILLVHNIYSANFAYSDWCKCI